jgi:recombination protein RecA
MTSLSEPAQRRTALDGLRAALSAEHRGASPEAYTLAEEGLVRSGFRELDAALGGGFPRGVVTTLEGPPGSGRSAIAARLLATATATGLAALVESPEGSEGAFYPPALAAAGVDLSRLVVVRAGDATAVARAADILLRSAAFGVVVIPGVSLRAAAWTRLASLTHRANAILVTLGTAASDELRYFASVRVRMSPTIVRWSGAGGLFCTLAGLEAEAAVLKHKRAAPGKRARIVCTTFETAGAPLARTTLRDRTIAATERTHARGREVAV